MLFSYDWVCNYLNDPPSLEEAARLLNATGLECEVEGDCLEIEHTVNRPDAMSHYGVARELAVKLGSGLVEPAIFEGEISDFSYSIESEDAGRCSRYMALMVENVHAAPSPDWLKQRLEKLGHTAHGLLIDLTNFLLWELGHPSHAFDADEIAGERIIVRMGTKGEKLTTLDGKDHSAEGFLCIADAEKPIAFGGVMGGQNSEVSDTTTRLLLELATFDPPTVRRTGRDLQIHSDARHRFERGIDPERMEFIIRRFIHLLSETQPEAKVVGLADMNLAPFKRHELTLRRQRLDQVLGIHLPDEKVEGLLRTMDFRPRANPSGWDVETPGYKVDVEREIDIIEEIIRFAGLDLLQSELPPGQGTSFEKDALRDGGQRIRDLMLGFGFQETVTYAFTPEAWENALGWTPLNDLVTLRNPMNKNQAVMRTGLLPSLTEVVRHNLNRGQDALSLFEISHVFQQGKEPHHLAGVLVLSKQSGKWWQTNQNHPYYHIKGVFESLSIALGWREALSLRDEAPSAFKAGEAIGIYHGESRIGGLGMLDSAFLKSWEIEADVAAFEMDLDFLAGLSTTDVRVEALSPFPAISMDMAFVVDRTVTFGAIRDHIATLQPLHLVGLDLFDHYQGKNLDKSKKSLGFRFRFQSKEETLTQEIVSKTMDALVESVKQQFGAVIRV